MNAEQMNASVLSEKFLIIALTYDGYAFARKSMESLSRAVVSSREPPTVKLGAVCPVSGPYLLLCTSALPLFSTF